MKYSFFAIGIGIINLIMEIRVNYRLIEYYNSILDSIKGDVSPSLVSGGMTLLFPLAILHFIGISISIIALVKKQKNSKLGLVINLIAASMLLIVPVWLWVI